MRCAADFREVKLGRNPMYNLVVKAGTRLSLYTCLLAGTGAAADAGDLAAMMDRPVSSSTDLELVVSGHIAPKCEIEWDPATVDLELSTPRGLKDYPVQVDCNQILDVELSSLHGGFRLQTNRASLPDVPGFTGFIPYHVIFSVNIPDATPVHSNSHSMQSSPQIGSVGVVPHQTTGNLRLSWDQDAIPFGGRYGDVIEIRASGRGR